MSAVPLAPVLRPALQPFAAACTSPLLLPDALCDFVVPEWSLGPAMAVRGSSSAEGQQLLEFASATARGMDTDLAYSPPETRRVPERTPETPLKMHDGVFKASPSSSIDLDAAMMASAKKPYSSPIHLSDGSKTNKRERHRSAETLDSSATSVMDVPLDVPLAVRLSS